MTYGRRSSRSTSRINNNAGNANNTNESGVQAAASSTNNTYDSTGQQRYHQHMQQQQHQLQPNAATAAAATTTEETDNSLANQETVYANPEPNSTEPLAPPSSDNCHDRAFVSAQSEADSDREADYDELKFTAPPPPKHIPFPDVPQPSEIMAELVMFMYTALAASTQFLHLYRSVWWLPDSNSTQAVVSPTPSLPFDLPRGFLLQNFYLIDTYLVVFIMVLLSRRFMYCVLMRLLQFMCPRIFVRFVLSVFRVLFFFAILVFLGLCCESLYHKQGYNIVYICYPLLVYFITFGLRFEPFLRTTYECPKATYLNGSPLHCCSTNPALVRDEIESLRSDYNNRFKQVVFSTVLNAYYAAFIPCCFAQSYLYYDIYWATQHMAFMLVGGFTMYTAICFPANYCDVMHRAAMHLGQWTRMEPSKYVIPARFWSRRVAWPGGMVVRYHGELYKATGLATMAVPGCAVHNRFFAFFQNPSSLYCVLAIVQLTVCVLQLIILYFVVEWHNILSLGFLLLANYYTLHRIGRDFGITQKVYAAEGSAYERVAAIYAKHATAPVATENGVGGADMGATAAVDD